MAGAVDALIPLQLIRKGALLVVLIIAVVLIAMVSTPPEWSLVHEASETVGLVLILACIAGRCWCTLYIGGRKGAELVDTGPYSVCRNPLYFFSFLGAAGVGAETGSVVIALLFLLATWLAFHMTVLREEAFLKGLLGEPYQAYLKAVPRFLPRPWLWKPGHDTIEIKPGRVVMTFLDGLVFLLAIPMFEGLEWLQGHHIIPVLLHLP
jgi:protein-S-isoprenylcysteine O-methyltransferase Ste14